MMAALLARPGIFLIGSLISGLTGMAMKPQAHYVFSLISINLQ